MKMLLHTMKIPSHTINMIFAHLPQQYKDIKKQEELDPQLKPIHQRPFNLAFILYFFSTHELLQASDILSNPIDTVASTLFTNPLFLEKSGPLESVHQLGCIIIDKIKQLHPKRGPKSRLSKEHINLLNIFHLEVIEKLRPSSSAKSTPTSIIRKPRPQTASRNIKKRSHQPTNSTQNNNPPPTKKGRRSQQPAKKTSASSPSSSSSTPHQPWFLELSSSPGVTIPGYKCDFWTTFSSLDIVDLLTNKWSPMELGAETTHSNPTQLWHELGPDQPLTLEEINIISNLSRDPEP